MTSIYYALERFPFLLTPPTGSATVASDLTLWACEAGGGCEIDGEDAPMVARRSAGTESA